ncbi:MAG: ABC transporter substrate-binding protein [Acetobacteraceae bacterium]|nr:ABC transporter substrate-binding protein [Acetobacteraceae bacterium]
MPARAKRVYARPPNRGHRHRQHARRARRRRCPGHHHLLCDVVLRPPRLVRSTEAGSARDLIRRNKATSGERLRIQFFRAGALITAAEGFAAVSQGLSRCKYANAYFWTSHSLAARYFTALPSRLNFQRLNGWMYDGGGLAHWREVYDRFDLVPFLSTNTGVQIIGRFRRPIETVEDLRGLKVSLSGLAGRVYQALVVDTLLLPASEIFPALERSVINAAEFVGPYLDCQLGLHRMAKFYETPGWHETATELAIKTAAWNRLPNDLKAIVENACAACKVLSKAWCQKIKAEAIEHPVRNHGVIAWHLRGPMIDHLREATTTVLAQAVGRDCVTRRVHESDLAYTAQFDAWPEQSEAPYHTEIRPVRA